MRIAAAMLVAALVAGPAAAQSTSPSNLKPETNCTIAPDSTRSGDDQNSSSMAMEKSAVLPEAGGEASSAAPTVQSDGKPMEVRKECPPDSKPK